MLRSSLAALVILLLTGCSETITLVQTPLIYIDEPENPFRDVPPAFQSNEAEILYVTDRSPIYAVDGSVSYGFHRSPSVAFGRVLVQMGENLSWDELVKESRTDHRSAQVPLRISEIDEMVRGPASNAPLVMIDGRMVDNPEVTVQRLETAERISEILAHRIAQTPDKEVLLYIHGYNNSFEFAAYRLAQLWHFLGRRGIPVMYSWPAGHPGLLQGYTYDRESGDFTILHLRRTIRYLAATPGVEKIHVVAHSRGTDIATTALRELHIWCRGGGLDTREYLKLDNLILAAPDLDLEVVSQRIGGEGLHTVPERLTIYLSKDDKAIGIASWLFASIRRLGRLRPEDLSVAARQRLKNFHTIQFVDVRVETDFLGHGYFVDNPAVLSDMILVLRDGLGPGEGRRNLRFESEAFWILDESFGREELRTQHTAPAAPVGDGDS